MYSYRDVMAPAMHKVVTEVLPITRALITGITGVINTSYLHKCCETPMFIFVKEWAVYQKQVFLVGLQVKVCVRLAICLHSLMM